ncbi:SIMPL domain-containing protein [Lentzea sp.]|uniref:SIMPL domain-containing protein n=1 Tax=Lentzea sp. TaxID=56099 RepID=UPI002CB2196A|nr:SIMPL domain-containing protein [Lentzea sp.]HUQ57524.1 SIMPL domain-containing protein [Lentzea sp.]
MAEVVTKGTGEVERTADRAQVDVTFEAVGADRSEAVSTLNQRISAVEPLLETFEVRSRQLSVHDNWDNNQRVGSRAQQQYVIWVSDLDGLDGLLAELVQAEPSWINGPSWTLVDDGDAVREAQKAAVADALRRAEGYASALGRRLGPLLRIGDTEGGGGYSPKMMRGGASFEMAGPAGMVDQLNLKAQQITVSAVCTAAWSLLD